MEFRVTMDRQEGHIEGRRDTGMWNVLHIQRGRVTVGVLLCYNKDRWNPAVRLRCHGKRRRAQ